MDVPQSPSIGSPLLMPFDGSANAEAVIPYLPFLLDSGGQIVLLQVIPTAQAVTSPIGTEMLSPAEVQRMTEVAARSDLDRAARRIGEHVSDVEIDQVVEIGEPAERINHVAVTRGVRAILLASQGYSGTGPGGFGSIVSRVVRTSPLPVI